MDELNAIVKVTRTGCYALIEKEGKTLLVKQEGGPYEGKWDLPGGRIEADEEAIQALEREITEELNGSFKSAKLYHVITSTFRKEQFVLTQVGILYKVEGFSTSGGGELDSRWTDLKNAPDEELAGLAKKAKHLNHTELM